MTYAKHKSRSHNVLKPSFLPFQTAAPKKSTYSLEWMPGFKPTALMCFELTTPGFRIVPSVLIGPILSGSKSFGISLPSCLFPISWPASNNRRKRPSEMYPTLPIDIGSWSSVVSAGCLFPIVGEQCMSELPGLTSLIVCRVSLSPERSPKA